jgi:hypothetical protein
MKAGVAVTKEGSETDKVTKWNTSNKRDAQFPIPFQNKNVSKLRILIYICESTTNIGPANISGGYRQK